MASHEGFALHGQEGLFEEAVRLQSSRVWHHGRHSDDGTTGMFISGTTYYTVEDAITICISFPATGASQRVLASGLDVNQSCISEVLARVRLVTPCVELRTVRTSAGLSYDHLANNVPSTQGVAFSTVLDDPFLGDRARPGGHRANPRRFAQRPKTTPARTMYPCLSDVKYTVTVRPA